VKERQLAIIMFTDFVGYSAIMGSDEDKAYKWLMRCIDERDSFLHFLNVCPRKDHRIPDEPRFKELMNKTGKEECKADLNRDQKSRD
jgi:hypothetical protein